MKRLLVLAACLAALLAPGAAQAHPLGNFTINRHTTIELSGGRIYVHYALDLAEIPTLQAGKRVRAAGFAAEAARGLELRVDGSRAPLRVLERRSGRAARCGRPEDAPLRRRLRDGGDRDEAGVPRPQLRRRGSAGRKWSYARATAPSCAPPAFRPRAGATTSAPTRRICSALRSTSRPRPLRSSLGEGSGHTAGARRRRGGRASRRRLRGADLPRRPLARRDPALARDRGLLGRSPRAHAGARQGDRRRLSRRHEGPARSTRCCSAGSSPSPTRSASSRSGW